MWPLIISGIINSFDKLYKEKNLTILKEEMMVDIISSKSNPITVTHKSYNENNVLLQSEL